MFQIQGLLFADGRAVFPHDKPVVFRSFKPGDAKGNSQNSFVNFIHLGRLDLQPG